MASGTKNPPSPPRASGAGAFLGAVAVVVVLNLVPHGETALYPLAVFTTWVHEIFHAATALVLGADVRTLVVRPDTSGLAAYAYDPSSFGAPSRAATASAGYLGAALAGALLLAAGRRPGLHRPVLAASTLLLAVSVALWVRQAFGVAALLGLAAALGAVALRGSPTVARWALLLLGLQTSLNALVDIRALYYVRGGTDAETMSRVVGLPPGFWATLWLLLGGAVVARAAWKALSSTGPG
jgi:hypothetical protein